MFWLKGVFRCDRLGVDDCVVWWDALAAGGAWGAVIIASAALWVAWLGIAVTSFSGYAVWRLGTEANGIAIAAQTTAERQRLREADFLRKYLLPEFMSVSSNVTSWLDAWPPIFDLFVHDDPDVRKDARESAFERLSEVDLVGTKAVLGRLHVFSGEEAAALANALALSGVANQLIQRLAIHAEELVNFRANLDQLESHLRTYANHLNEFLHLATGGIVPRHE